MITLYTFGPQFGLPDPSPFVMKAETLLKMSGLPFRTDTTGFPKAPKGKLPYIDDDGEKIADSTFIRWHLEKKYQIDFDRGLTPEQRAIAWAFEKLAEDHLYWALVDARSYTLMFVISGSTNLSSIVRMVSTIANGGNQTADDKPAQNKAAVPNTEHTPEPESGKP